MHGPPRKSAVAPSTTTRIKPCHLISDESQNTSTSSLPPDNEHSRPQIEQPLIIPTVPPAAKRRCEEIEGEDNTHDLAYQKNAAVLRNQYPVIGDMIEVLNEAELRSLLLSITSTVTSGHSQPKLMATYDAHMENLRAAAAREQARIVNFDHYSKEAWYTLNKSYYAKLSSSKQYDAAGDVFDSVKGCIDSIGAQIRPESSCGTKLNAVETIRKIAKIILLGNDCLASEVRKQFQYDTALSDNLVAILEEMTFEECLEAGQNVSEAGKGTLLEKMEWVRGMWKGHCLSGEEDLDYVIDLLSGQAGEEEEAEDEGKDVPGQSHPSARQVITID